MPSILVEGGNPLIGTVNVSGARNSALKLVIAALFSNEDTVIENVPRTQSILDDIEIVKSVGAIAEWTGSNRLMINGSQINSFEVPLAVGTRFRTALLMAGPLLFRFGKALIPKYKSTLYQVLPVNRILDTWKSFGITIGEDDDFWKLSADAIHPASIMFKVTSHLATDNAILCAAFVVGETTISNASEESEIDDLIKLLVDMGVDIKRTEPRTIKVVGTNIFREARVEVQPDKIEAATFATAALITKGNIIVNNIDKSVMIPFVNFLNKLGARFEFENRALKVWRHDETLQPLNLTISPTPGFVPDWAPLATLLLTQAEGESLVHNTVFTKRFEFIRDLNRAGSKIDLLQPSKAGMVPVISDDSYDFEKEGEPYTVAKIAGPTKLKPGKFYITDFRYGAVLALAALAAGNPSSGNGNSTGTGKSEVGGIEIVEDYIDNFTDKLINLGAKIWKQWE